MAFEGSNTTNFGSAVTGQANEFWSPEIFSKKVQLAFRKSAVAEAVCNTDYQGEIGSYGDSVKIIKEPTITVYDYNRGDTLTNSALTDQELTLVVDQAKSFQFTIDDLEERFSHVNWQAVASDQAAYRLKDAMDSNVFAAMAAASGISSYGSLTDAIDVGHGTSEVDPLNLLAYNARLLDDLNVPEENRWVVAPPAFYEALANTSSKLLSVDYNQGDGGLRNGLVASGQLRGFKLYKSNNLPAWQGTGTSAAFSGNNVIAGHMSATSCASALSTLETVRSTSTFADIIRGLLVWGRKVLRPEGLVLNYANLDAD
ncbi:hypothetical protein N9937_01985 [bacterium]|nr:hypothetical protein [bacterium]